MSGARRETQGEVGAPQAALATVRRWSRRSGGHVLGGLLAAGSIGLCDCSRNELGSSPDETLQPEHVTVDAIPINPVAGRLAGRPFEVGDSRFRVDRRPGYERVDIHLNQSAATEPCGGPLDPDSATVWVRFPGRTDVEPGTMRRTAARGDFEVHLSALLDDVWVGHGTAAALLVIETFDPMARVTGALSVCFADEQRSCVAGTFDATACADPLDEPPRSYGAASKEEIERWKARLADAGARSALKGGGASGEADVAAGGSHPSAGQKGGDEGSARASSKWRQP